MQLRVCGSVCVCVQLKSSQLVNDIVIHNGQQSACECAGQIGTGHGVSFGLCLCCPVEFTCCSHSLSPSISNCLLYGIIELRGLMAAASLIWLSARNHMSRLLPPGPGPSLDDHAERFGKRQSFVQSFFLCFVLIARSLWLLVIVVVAAAVVVGLQQQQQQTKLNCSGVMKVFPFTVAMRVDSVLRFKAAFLLLKLVSLLCPPLPPSPAFLTPLYN